MSNLNAIQEKGNIPQHNVRESVQKNLIFFLRVNLFSFLINCKDTCHDYGNDTLCWEFK